MGFVKHKKKTLVFDAKCTTHFISLQIFAEIAETTNQNERNSNTWNCDSFPSGMLDFR